MRTLDDARLALRDALDAGDLPRARRAIRPWPALRGPDEALLWTELLWADRDHPDRQAIASTLLEAWPQHGEIVHPCAEILLDTLGGFVPGDPPSADPIAKQVVDAVDQCLAARPDYGEEARRLLARTRASALSRRSDAPADEVETAWAEVLSADPDDGPAWFELTLWLKIQGRFREALGAALQAAARLGPSDAVWWNVGICATGCGEHAHAADAWARLGMHVVQADDGPPHLPEAGPRWVRVVTTDRIYGDPGVARVEADVRIAPIGPCDGQVVEVSAPGLPVAVGDRVLHDGTPLGLADDGRPRLPALAVLQNTTL